MNTIRIGDEWVEVPLMYIQMETEYTKVETRWFRSSEGWPDRERARQAVLQKRVEFHKKVQSGEIIIPDPLPPKVSWFTKLISRLTS